MSTLVDMFEPNEVIFTMAHGVVQAFRVESDGTMAQIDTAGALKVVR